MPARTLMLQGTSSSVGKSLLTAGLCRLFVRRGLRVAPFKAQNMSNNAAVCPDGAEIGRAQAVQAAAAGIEPCADMNPVLLKPEGRSRSQVVVLGRAWQSLSAQDLQQRKRDLWPIVTAALDRLRQRFDLVMIEGAGSPVELNLAHGDIVNMALARHAHSPVLLIGDIDRGGIFAQLLGTLWLLSPQERSLVKGLIVNKFRGDRRLFDDGVRILQERAELPVLGVVPYLDSVDIPEEDAAEVKSQSKPAGEVLRTCGIGIIDIAVIRLPHIANFDDFDPLSREMNVRVRYVDGVLNWGSPTRSFCPAPRRPWPTWPGCAKQGSTWPSLPWRGNGAALVGICGGYQMLGQTIRDPDCVESSQQEMAGLGLLAISTDFAGDKATHQVRATIIGGEHWLANLRGASLHGYEIHMGRSAGPCRPWLEIHRQSAATVAVTDGAMSDTGRIWGCYVHGLFANDAFRRAWLGTLLSDGRLSATPGSSVTSKEVFESALDRLADSLEAALDMESIARMI